MTLYVLRDKETKAVVGIATATSRDNLFISADEFTEPELLEFKELYENGDEMIFFGDGDDGYGCSERWSAYIAQSDGWFTMT